MSRRWAKLMLPSVPYVLHQVAPPTTLATVAAAATAGSVHVSPLIRMVLSLLMYVCITVYIVSAVQRLCLMTRHLRLRIEQQTFITVYIVVTRGRCQLARHLSRDNRKSSQAELMWANLCRMLPIYW